ncbi:MAG: hypothetical protein ACRDFQ_05345 [Anaerolineales bacterium]
MSSDVLIQEALRVLTSILCFFIAVQLGGRELTEPGDRLAWKAFRIWWAGLGVTTFISVLNAILPLLGITQLAVYLAITQLNILVLCIALWGLLSYLIYLYTGKVNWTRYLAVFYFLFFLALVFYILSQEPTSVVVEGGVASIRYARELGPAYILALTLVLLVPELLASLAYFSFYFRVKERTQKYRVLLVSASIFVWFSSPLVAQVLDISDLDWWQLASRLITLSAALVIYWAYYPPKFLQERLQVAPI